MPRLSPSSPWQPKRLARTAAFMLAAVAIAAAAFAAVLWFQPALAPATEGSRTSPAVVLDDPPDPQLVNGVGPGDGAWLRSYENGHLTSEFRAREYTPQKDGTIDVDRPECHFFLGRGEVLVLTGDTGKVAFDRSTGGGGGMPTAMRSPDNGKLQGVHIELRPTVDGRATLTMDTDNVRFDNDTLRVYTETIPATKLAPAVPADRVPVTVRGDDYALDGTGLTLRWNGRDRRLHLLEIAHGNRLTILHPGGMGRGTTAAADVTEPQRPPATVPPGSPVEIVPAVPAVSAVRPGLRPSDERTAAPHALVSADPPVASPAVEPPAPTPAPPYRAVFNDDVRIVQGTAAAAARTIGTGDVLTLDFFQGKPATTRPAATGPAPTTVPSTVPAGMPAAGTVAAIVPSTRRATTLATTRPGPAEEPVTIYWTGRLRVTPLETSSPMMPLDPGQAVVRLAGRPAVLTYGGAMAEAGRATYRTGDGAVQLLPSSVEPTVHLSQPQKQLDLVSGPVDYDPAVSVATIMGPATLTAGEGGGRTMRATWAGRGLLHVLRAGADPTGVDHVDLIGTPAEPVRAVDPRFSLISRRLLLDLEPVPAAGTAAAQVRLRRLTSVGGVACRLLRPGEPDQGIESDRLVVGMATAPDGSAAPRDVIADGRQVRAFDATQALYADHLRATLAPKPSTRPTTGPADDAVAAVGLETLLATGHVRAVLKNGSTAVADTLREATAADGRQLVELAAAAGAHVTDAKHNELVGSVLHVSPDRGVVVVDGPGTLHTVGKPAAGGGGGVTGGGGRVIDVSWVDALTFDNSADGADVVGRVLVRSVGADGTVDLLAGDRAHIDLIDDPAAKTPVSKTPVSKTPVSKASVTKAETAKAPADANLGQKKLKAVTLLGHVHATSDLAVGGVTVRHGELFGSRERPAGDRLVYTDADGVARMLGPGRLFVENHRPVASAAAAAGGKFGVMAIRWRDRLAYETAGDRITIDGDVRVGFQQDAQHAPAGGGPVQMQSRQVVIRLRRTAPAPGPAKAGQDKAGQDKARVADLTATGAVHCRAGTLDMDCHTATFDPDAGVLTATGSDAEPGRATNALANGASTSGGFESMRFDTVNQKVIDGTGITGTLRR